MSDLVGFAYQTIFPFQNVCNQLFRIPITTLLFNSYQTSKVMFTLSGFVRSNPFNYISEVAVLSLSSQHYESTVLNVKVPNIALRNWFEV